MAIAKKTALTASGKLKPGYFFGKGGRLKKAKPKRRTRLYSHAKALGSAGGKATARKKKRASR